MMFVLILQALEELGFLSQIKRFAGASAGAMTASLLAVGYDSKDIQGFLSQDLSLILLGKKRLMSNRIFTPCKM